MAHRLPPQQGTLETAMKYIGGAKGALKEGRAPDRSLVTSAARDLIELAKDTNPANAAFKVKAEEVLNENIGLLRAHSDGVDLSMIQVASVVHAGQPADAA